MNGDEEAKKDKMEGGLGLLYFMFTFTVGSEVLKWPCAAVDLAAACRGFCVDNPDVEEFSVTLGDPIAVVEVYGDGSGVSVT